MTASRDGASIRAILALVRPIADEIVLGVDARRAELVLSGCGDLVDRCYLYDYTGTVERHLAWLHHRCTADWILRLDDDEWPSSALLAALPELVADRRRTLALLPRRHLFPTRERYIVSHPWFPDYQPRLVRNVPGVWSFAGHPHTAIEVLGERRRVPDAPLYHLHFAQAGLESRLATAQRREREMPDLRSEDFPVNAISLPELWTDVETAAVPPEDRDAVERVAVPAAVDPVPLPACERMDQREADRLLMTREVLDDAYQAEITISASRRRLLAGSVAHLEVAVRNLGYEHWPPAHHEAPLIRLAYRWLAADGETVVEPEGPRTPFEETVLPGERTVAMLAVRVPAEAGRYRLEVDVVHELVRWFGCASQLAITVAPADGAGSELGPARPDMSRIDLGG
jgi:hypothetical protein